ncbi:MAG: Uma2 family endonuclease [Phycisphaerae bacterium]
MASAPHSISPGATSPPVRYFPITVDMYHKMIETGLLPEGAPYELIHGQIVAKDRSACGEGAMIVGLFHALTIKKLARLDGQLRRTGCHLQVQLPLALARGSEPEPDAAIVVGDEDGYRGGHPSAKDVLCVIEVADSSLRYDRTTKQSLYAAHSVPMYLIVNLVDRAIEVYSEPLKRAERYGRVETLAASKKLLLPTAKKPLAVSVRRLLP